MINRRALLAGSALLLPNITIFPASALTLHTYDAVSVEKLIKSGKPVVIHVYASWCLQCHAQASILASLKDDKYNNISFFRVDYDNQKDTVAALKCPRSTVISYHGGKEIARVSWVTDEKSVIDVLNTAL